MFSIGSPEKKQEKGSDGGGNGEKLEADSPPGFGPVPLGEAPGFADSHRAAAAPKLERRESLHDVAHIATDFPQVELS